MGLSFHYSGSFNPEASLMSMIEEVKDIAKLNSWKYFVFEDTFPSESLSKTEYLKDIYGISFTPPKCETVNLCFLSNGKMSSPTHLQLFGNSQNPEYQKFLYMLSVKTQYAGIEVHKQIINLLKYLSKKYLMDFSLSDEGHYWETNDEKLLQDTFNRYTEMMDSFASSIEIFPKLEGESLFSYFERLFKQILRKKK